MFEPEINPEECVDAKDLLRKVFARLPDENPKLEAQLRPLFPQVDRVGHKATLNAILDCLEQGNQLAESILKRLLSTDGIIQWMQLSTEENRRLEEWVWASRLGFHDESKGGEG